MFELLIEAFQYGFFQRALIIGILIAISSSFLGGFLVLRKYSMIGDGLAHVSFASVALALLFDQSPLLFSIPIVILAAIFILFLNEKTKVHGDSAIGLVSSFAMACGVLIINIGSGFNVDIESYLFGNILTTDPLDILLAFILALIVIFTVIFFYHPLFSITYDEEYAEVTFKTRFSNYMLAILTALTIVLGIRFIGTMLISSLIIFPTITALQLSKGFKQTIILSSFIGVIAVLIGIIASVLVDTPPGATIVIANGAIFFITYLYKKVQRG